jgi:hypothetical protein
MDLAESSNKVSTDTEDGSDSDSQTENPPKKNVYAMGG